MTPSETAQSTNIFKVEHKVSRTDRRSRNGHLSGVLWFTGLSGFSETTLSLAVEKVLHGNNMQTYVLDGKNLRSGLTSDLAYSYGDRMENIRRVGEVAAMFADSGQIVIASFISPYRANREMTRAIHPENFHEVYLKSNQEVCERRDPKGLYKKARAGQIENFTGISASSQEPETPELVVETASLNIEESVDLLLKYVAENFALQDSVRIVA